MSIEFVGYCRDVALTIPGMGRLAKLLVDRGWRLADFVAPPGTGLEAAYEDLGAAGEAERILDYMAGGQADAPARTIRLERGVAAWITIEFRNYRFRICSNDARALDEALRLADNV